MRVVVVGATGMVGSRVVDEAAARGHRVVAASRRPARGPDEAGASRISVEDLAVAVPDELEHPGEERHVTVAEATRHVVGTGSR